MEGLGFLSTVAEGIALEVVKAKVAEIFPDLVKFCGARNLKDYIQQGVPLLALLPPNSAERALEGGVIIASREDAEYLFDKFPGLRHLSTKRIADWEKRLRKALNGAPGYASSILALETDDVVDDAMEVVTDKRVTREWLTVTVEDLKDRLRPYMEE